MSIFRIKSFATSFRSCSLQNFGAYVMFMFHGQRSWKKTVWHDLNELNFQSHSNSFVLCSVEVQLDHLYFLGSNLAWMSPRKIAKLNEDFGQFVSIDDWANMRIQQSMLKLRCLHFKSALALLVLLVNWICSFYTQCFPSMTLLHSQRQRAGDTVFRSDFEALAAEK